MLKIQAYRGNFKQADAHTNEMLKAAGVNVNESAHWMHADWSKQRRERPRRDPRGFFLLSDDQALDEASRKINADFEYSIDRTVSEL